MGRRVHSLITQHGTCCCKRKLHIEHATCYFCILQLHVYEIVQTWTRSLTWQSHVRTGAHGTNLPWFSGPKEYEFPGPKEYEFPEPKKYEFPGPKEHEFSGPKEYEFPKPKKNMSSQSPRNMRFMGGPLGLFGLGGFQGV